MATAVPSAYRYVAPVANAELTGPINAKHANLMQISSILLLRPRAKLLDRVDLTLSLRGLCS
jgi:hypothetical protein